MTLEGAMGACMAVEGSTKAFVFEAYAEHFLAPTLRPGQIVVMDNLGAHKTHKVRELIESRGCELWFLPTYSPDLNPIEEAFSKVKARLRKAAARRGAYSGRSPGGGNGRGALRDHTPRCTGMVRPLCLRFGRPTFMNTAVSRRKLLTQP